MILSKFYLNLSIKYKLLILVYIIILVMSVTFGVYSYKISVSQVRERITTSNIEIVNQISNHISFLQSDTLDLSSFIAINDGIQDVLDSSYNQVNWLPEQQIKNQAALQFILSAIVSKDYLSGVALLNSKGTPISTYFTDGSSSLDNIHNKRFKKIADKIESLNGEPYWFSISKSDTGLLRNNENAKIVMGRVIKNVNSAQKIGYMFLFINETTIQDIYESNLHSHMESFFITDQNNNIVSLAGNPLNITALKSISEYKPSPMSLNNSFDVYDGEKTLLIARSPISSSNWEMYYSVPTQEMIDQISSIKWFTLLMILIACILTFPFLLMISTYFTSPIKKLLNSMKRFEKGDFNEHVNFKSRDEIGMLGDGYNRMVENIKELIDSSYRLQIKEKEAELRALQAQINPHFLYNTLNTIYWKAIKTGQEEIGEMTMLLSQLFRLTLNMGKDWVTIKDERELIYSYLSLQAIRFRDRLTFTLDISESLWEYNIPKLLLQPFVENAVVHGLSDKKDGGEVLVSAYEMHDRLYFTVKDNGLGMNSDLVNALNNLEFDKISGDSNHSGYASKNVYERLQLTYGNDFSLRYKSTLGEGTIVQINFPIISRI